MSRLLIFLLGAVVGGGVVYSAVTYHVVRGEDGLHMVPKLSANFSQPYVDVRNFGAADWGENRALTVAVLRAEKGHLLQDAATDSMAEGLGQLAEGLQKLRD
jgi:X-X-X-Leu-X-X-Gly heptad repeat protein